MKTNEISLTNDWTFKRILRVSIKVALIYAFVSIIWTLIYGANLEIIWKIRLENRINTIPLVWNSWSIIFINFVGIILLGILVYIINKLIFGLKDSNPEKDLSIGVWISLVLGLIVSSVSLLKTGLVIHLVVGLIAGLILFFVCVSLALLFVFVGELLSKLFKFLFGCLWWLIKKLFFGFSWAIKKLFLGLGDLIKKPVLSMYNKLISFFNSLKKPAGYIKNKLIVWWTCLIK